MGPFLLVRRWATDRPVCDAAKVHLSPCTWTLLTIFSCRSMWKLRVRSRLLEDFLLFRQENTIILLLEIMYSHETKFE